MGEFDPAKNQQEISKDSELVGSLIYKGNSVGYIYMKMESRGNQIHNLLEKISKKDAIIKMLTQAGVNVVKAFGTEKGLWVNENKHLNDLYDAIARVENQQ